MAEIFSFPTTTLIIDQTKINFDVLKENYRLIRYVLPDDWAARGKGLYKRLYVQLREQLEIPYLVFQHDKIESTKKRVIYALYEQDEENNKESEHIKTAELNFDFLSDTENPLPKDEIQFDQIELHNLVKLLQASFANFHPYFASMGKYYIHIDTEREGWERCMEIQIRGALRNRNTEGKDSTVQEFWISGHSRYFKQLEKSSDEISPKSRKYNAYYKKSYDKSGFVVFKQLTHEELDNHIGPLFYLYSKSTNKPHIDYHNQTGSKIEPCRGYALHRFITRFKDWLSDMGIPASQKTRDWIRPKLKVADKKKELNLTQLSTIYLYDVRWNTTSNSVIKYKKLLENMFPSIEWEVITNISDKHNQPTLILQDATQDDYKQGNKLADKLDPYLQIKTKYPKVPTQFINVNPHDAVDRADQQSYLSYPVVELQRETKNGSLKITEWGRKFQVAILQLFMKNLVLNDLPVSEYLPLSGVLSHLKNYGYVRKRSYRDGDSNKSIGYRAFLKFDKDKMFFSNLSDPSGRKILEEMCEDFGYDWYAIEDALIERQFNKDKSKKEEKDLSSYDLVLMSNLVILIDELEETVLYKYDEIKRRLEGRTIKRHVEDLLLRDHYEKIKPKDAKVSVEDLEYFGYPDEIDETLNTDSVIRSSEFLNQLDQYDKWLRDEVNPIHSRISIRDLRNEHADKIVEIFGWENRDSGKETTLLLDYYKTIFKLGAATGKDVQLSKGIYFDETDNSYRVGGVDGLKQGSQDRANRIRRFEAIHGDTSALDPQPLLEALSVQFVRYNRYTVHPFPFYLLDMYINDVLRAV